MKIIELHLKGYERLFLGSINEVIYKPENRMQVILGSNGIGKSSLLYMLSPLPADINADFVEDGFKIIKIFPAEGFMVYLRLKHQKNIRCIFR